MKITVEMDEIDLVEFTRWKQSLNSAKVACVFYKTEGWVGKHGTVILLDETEALKQMFLEIDLQKDQANAYAENNRELEKINEELTKKLKRKWF